MWIFKVKRKLPSKNNTLVTLCVVNLECKSWIIRKIHFQINFISYKNQEPTKTEPKSKNPLKFADIRISDVCNVRSIKLY